MNKGLRLMSAVQHVHEIRRKCAMTGPILNHAGPGSVTTGGF